MKSEEKRMIGILILITILVIIVGIVMSINKGKKDDQGNKVVVGEEERNTEKVEEFVSLQEDGTKVNTSNKLKETKTIDGLEIGKLQLTTKDNVSLILGEIKNVSDTEKGGYPVSFTILDKEGNEIITIGAYMQKLQPGQTGKLDASATFDFANAYDFRIAKK